MRSTHTDDDPRRTEGTIDVLLATHRQFLAFLERHTASREDAEDILQEAFMKAIERGDRLRRGESVRAWFYRLLRRAVIDRHRSEGARHRALGRFAEEQETAQDVESAICRCIEGLLPTLPRDQAHLLRRIELEGLPLQEEARALGISPNATAARLLRARRALLRQLQRSCRVCAVHGCLDCSC